jgi:hypothetical protein
MLQSSSPLSLATERVCIPGNFLDQMLIFVTGMTFCRIYTEQENPVGYYRLLKTFEKKLSLNCSVSSDRISAGGSDGCLLQNHADAEDGSRGNLYEKLE